MSIVANDQPEEHVQGQEHGPKDQVLRDVVQPVVHTVARTGAADRWFFVRYGDPDWHLHLRFHGRPARLQSGVLPALQAAAAPLLEDGRIWRFHHGCYCC